MVAPSKVDEGGAGDGLLTAMNEAAGSEAGISGGTVLSGDAAHDFFPDDKNGADVEAVVDDVAAGNGGNK